jgi:hypothetical protein
MTFDKFLKDYVYKNPIGFGIVVIIVVYAISVYMNYLNKKGSSGYEYNTQMQTQYKGSNGSSTQSGGSGSSGGVKPSDPNGNEVFASANGTQTSMPGLPTSCSQPNIQNPAELLPKDSNSQWAQLNPSGKGELANVNLLKAGYHIGIDTIGQTLRNANLQIRSEPPNPQLNVGPWNQSTIDSDFMRPPLEIGSGPQ